MDLISPYLFCQVKIQDETNARNVYLLDMIINKPQIPIN